MGTTTFSEPDPKSQDANIKVRKGIVPPPPPYEVRFTGMLGRGDPPPPAPPAPKVK